MKKKIIVLMVILFLLVIALSYRKSEIKLADEIDDVIIEFSDNKLYAALVEEMTDNYVFDATTNNVIVISPSELSKIKEINLGERRISNITGLEKFTSLEKIDLCNNSIQNIAPLTSLANLKEINLNHNKVSSLANISNLTALEHLSLYNNKVRDFSPLLGMTSLLYLDLGYNNSDKKTLTGIEAINSLTGLKYLDFSYNFNKTIVDNVSNLVNLEILNLQNNNIDSIDSLSSLVKMKEIYLHNNYIVDISPLLNMPLLEVIYLRANQIQYLTGIVVDNHLIWENARVISIYNISVLKDNTPEVNFLRNMALNREIELGYAKIFDTSNLPHVDENGIEYVTYEDFGARCDGVYDDTLALRAAHDFANSNGYEVRAGANKTYHLFNYYEDRIAIRTNTDWNNATFIIHDEELENKANRLNPLITVDRLTKDNVTINNPNVTLNTGTKKLIGIEETLENLNAKGYKKYYVVAKNANKKQFLRGSSEPYEEGYDQIDCFQIDTEGNLLNDIQWDFESVTSIEIYPIQDKTLKLQNATFISIPINGNHSGNPSEFYHRTFKLMQASNIEVTNITHTLSEDRFSAGYYGFFHLLYTSDVKFKDINLFARKQRVSTIDKRSSYELKLEQSTNIYFENVQSNGLNDFDRWGFMASQYCKDVYFDNARVNRIDAHEGIYNLTVRDSYVGYHGFTLVGQGVLQIDNTTVESSQFITFRWDYGSFWNGDIYIRNCTHKYQGIYAFKFANLAISLEGDKVHDYGYETHLPNMYFENYSVQMNGQATYYFIGNFEDKRTEYASPSYWPKKVIINGFKYLDETPGLNFKFLKQQNEDISGSYSFIDVKLLKDGVDISEKLFTEDYEESKGQFTLTMKKNVIAESNSITIYKDGKMIVNNQTVDDTFTYTFKDVGVYRILVNSSEGYFSKTGQIDYRFTIYTDDEVSSISKDMIYRDNLEDIVLETNISNNVLNNDYKVYVGDTLLTSNDYRIDNSNIVILKSFLRKLKAGKYKVILRNSNNNVEFSKVFRILEDKNDTSIVYDDDDDEESPKDNKETKDNKFVYDYEFQEDEKTTKNTEHSYSFGVIASILSFLFVIAIGFNRLLFIKR